MRGKNGLSFQDSGCAALGIKQAFGVETEHARGNSVCDSLWKRHDRLIVYVQVLFGLYLQDGVRMSHE